MKRPRPRRLIRLTLPFGRPRDGAGAGIGLAIANRLRSDDLPDARRGSVTREMAKRSSSLMAGSYLRHWSALRDTILPPGQEIIISYNLEFQRLKFGGFAIDEAHIVRPSWSPITRKGEVGSEKHMTSNSPSLELM
jgi:hypothetical protein